MGVIDPVEVARPMGLALATPDRVTSGRYFATKRFLDVILSILMLLLLAPLMALIALVVLIESGRPVMFSQQRVGVRAKRTPDGVCWELRVFEMLKFRTMVAGAELSPIHEEFIQAFTSASTEGESKIPHDPRVTRGGALLRGSSLDELPQLFNVLTGSMSLVGPRPVPIYEIAAYQPCHWERLRALPGITGAWQVRGRGRVTFEDMIRMDIDYVHRQSVLEDLRLLARTIPAVISGKGAR